jgi:hypothetical protein
MKKERKRHNPSADEDSLKGDPTTGDAAQLLWEFQCTKEERRRRDISAALCNTDEGARHQIPQPSDESQPVWEFPSMEPRHDRWDENAPNPHKDFWIFKTGELNPEQLLSCVIYEYARIVPWIKKAYRECREGKTPPKGVEWNFDEEKQVWSFDSEPDSIFEGVCFTLPPGFPDKPYLTTKLGQATHRIVKKDSEPRSSVIDSKPRSSVEEVEPDDLRFGKSIARKSGFLPASLMINWEVGTDKVCKDFRTWFLAQCREFDLKPKRVAPTTDQALQARLRELSAFRLYMFYDFTTREPYPFLKQFPDCGLSTDVEKLQRNFRRARITFSAFFNDRYIPTLREIGTHRRRWARKEPQSAFHGCQGPPERGGLPVA